MIISITIGLIGLGIVVFFHEAGHFLAAKAFGITVETFSLGWGKKLFSFKKGETEYRISLLPLGGYCQMKGEEVFRQALEKNQDYIDAEKGSLYSVAPWKRMIVFFAGPFMNLLFSIVVLSIIWYAGFTYYSPKNRIILASEYNPSENTFPADTAGLKSGDKILEIDNLPVESYQDIRESAILNPGETIALKILRGNNTIELSLTPILNKSTGGGQIGVYPWIPPVIGEIMPDSPAEIAGLTKNDTIIEVNGKPVFNQMDVFSAFNSRPATISIKYLKADTPTQEKEVRMVLEYDENGEVNPGFSFKIDEFKTPDYSILSAIKKGVTESFTTLFISIKGLKTLFMGVDINQALSGPIRITYMVGEAASKAFEVSIKHGLINFFQFLSLISIVLFFMNLLPIPALDGGQIVFSLCETIARRQFKPRSIYRYQMIGFVFIIFLIIFSFFNDILFFIKQ